jgi:hypothetical protein
VAALGDDFSDLLFALADEGAQFLVVGGWALAFHGHRRGTDDLDVWVSASARTPPIEPTGPAERRCRFGRGSTRESRLASTSAPA